MHFVPLTERSKMKVFVTFTDKHKHTINGQLFDQDTIAVIECTSSGKGREKAFDIFGCAFFLCFDDSVFNVSKHNHKTFREI